MRFTLAAAQLAFWDEGRWRIEAGPIEIMVGASTADIRVRGQVRIGSAGFGVAPATAIETPSSDSPTS